MQKPYQLIAGLALIAAATAAPSQVVVTATQVSNENFTQGNSVVVQFAVTANSFAIAPQAGTLRVTFDNALLSFQGASSDPAATWPTVSYPAAPAPADFDFATAVTTDGGTSPNNFRDVGTLGAAAFPATNLTPICFYVRFEITAAGEAAGTAPVGADIISTTTTHFPFFTPSTAPYIGKLDINPLTDIIFVPVNVTSVEGWTLFED
jgi:hypothetical protein